MVQNRDTPNWSTTFRQTVHFMALRVAIFDFHQNSSSFLVTTIIL